MITVKRTNVREKNEVMSTINLFEQRHFFVRTEEIFLSKILIFSQFYLIYFRTLHNKISTSSYFKQITKPQTTT